VIRHHPENFVRYADGTTNTWLNPVVKHAYRIRGFAYVDKGQYDKAIPDFTEAIRLNPNDADAYAVRAKAYRAVGEDAKAASDEWRAQELRPRP
jgi:Tfp pilus assembly protein PilF